MGSLLKRHRPSPASALAFLALIVALAGTAQGLPGRNSVDRNDLKRNVVKSKHIKDGNVQSPDLADGDVQSADLADGAVRSADLADGDVQSVDLVGCATGTTLINGVCWDQAARGPATSVFEASDDCAARGGRLPTTMQLLSVRDVPGFDLGVDATTSAHYSDSAHKDSGTSYVLTVADNGNLTQVIMTADQSYRCIYERIR